MGLRDYAPAVETIDLPNGDSFVVRGLSLNDITALVRDHYDMAAALFDKYVAAASSEAVDTAIGIKDGNHVRDAVLDALKAAPGLLSDTIAHAADEPDMAGNVARLPLGVQIEAVEAVIRLTLEAEGGLEKLIGTVEKLAGSVAGLTVDRSR